MTHAEARSKRSSAFFSAFSAAPRAKLVDARPKAWHDGVGQRSPQPEPDSRGLGPGIHEFGSRDRAEESGSRVLFRRIALELVDARAKPWHDECVCCGNVDSVSGKWVKLGDDGKAAIRLSRMPR